MLDSSDTLDGAPGDDPLDRGVVTPDRWSAGIRFGTTAEEIEAGESLDQQLAEEEPDITSDADDEHSDDVGADENAAEEESAGTRAPRAPIPGRAASWPKTRKPTTTARSPYLPVTTSSLVTRGSTGAGRPPKRRRSTSWTTTPTHANDLEDCQTGTPPVVLLLPAG